MGKISDHERLLTEFANLTESSAAAAFKQIGEKYEWIETSDEAIGIMSRLRGILIASLCGELEELVKMGISKILPQLSNKEDKKTSKFTHEYFPEKSSLKGRLETMWAIRIAFTHGNGLFSQIDDPKVAAYLTETHLTGISIVNDRIILQRQVTISSVRTAVEIFEKFK